MLGYLYELYNGYFNKRKDFYYLSLIKEADGYYSIHGLWPQYSLQSYPTFCRPVNFSLTKLDPIMDKLNKYWYSTKGSNSTFWKHEYEKHGSCMFQPMNELNYFSKTIEIYEYLLVNNIIKIRSEKNPTANKLLIALDVEFNLI
jgi:ribonuclease I